MGNLTERIKIILHPKFQRNAFNGDILWHFDFSTKQYDLQTNSFKKARSFNSQFHENDHMTFQCKWPITKKGRSKSCLRKKLLNRPCHLRIRPINTRTSLSRDVYSQLNFHFFIYADIQTYLLFCFSCNFSSNSKISSLHTYYPVTEN